MAGSKNAKKRAKKAQQKQQNMMIGAGVAVVALALLIGYFAFGMGGSNGETINAREYQSDFSDTEHFLLDVRTLGEYNSGHIQGSSVIPVEELANRLDEVPRDVPVVVYCRSGNRSAQASDILLENGFTDVYDLGGINDWISAGFSVVQ